MYQSIPGVTLIQSICIICGVDCKEAEFIGKKNKQMHSLTNIQTLNFVYCSTDNN